MTEAEWLVSNDPRVMLAYVSDWLRTPGQIDVSDRKVRLFACAACRQVWHLLADERSRWAVEVVERYAEGEAAEKEFTVASMEATAARQQSPYCPWNEKTPDQSRDMAALAVCNLFHRWAISAAHEAGRLSRFDAHAQADLLRDIFGNPFRPVSLNPAWLTPDVVQLTHAAYDERLPDREKCGGCHGTGKELTPVYADGPTSSTAMEVIARRPIMNSPCRRCKGSRVVPSRRVGQLDPACLSILADALEEAGCDSEDLLRHLRSEFPHVRGCWALDLVLGKS